MAKKSQDKKRRHEKSSGRGEGRVDTGSFIRIPKTLGTDFWEQFLDTVLGPIMGWVIDRIPDRFFEGERSRQILGSSGWIGNLFSVYVGQKTNMPNWVDSIRTRAVSAWTDRIRRRLKGEKSDATISKKLEETVGIPLQASVTNMIMFLLQLDEIQLAAWQTGMSDLTDTQRKRLVNIFSGLKDRHIDRIVRGFKAKRNEPVDWGQFFMILSTMGILPADAEEKKAEAAGPKDRSPEAMQKILNLTGDEMDKVRTTITSFLTYVAEHISRKGHGEVLNLMFDWSDDQFKTFAEFPSHEGRAAFLLGQIVDDSSMKDKMSSFVSGIKELIGPLGNAVISLKELGQRLIDHYVNRAKDSRERTDNAIKDRRNANKGLREQLFGPIGGDSK